MTIAYEEKIKNQDINKYSRSRPDEKSGQEDKTMEKQENTVSWDDALHNKNFVQLEEDQETTIVITDWKLVEVHKFDEDMVEFQAQVIEHDGKIGDKEFTTTSNRLKAKLRPVLEGKDPTTSVKISILPVGKNFERQYRVQEVKK